VQTSACRSMTLDAARQKMLADEFRRAACVELT
jgi:hypothetical protein